MVWLEKYLDLILVPSGLIIMFGYHLHLLYRIIKHPHTTIIGYENHNKKAWVERVMKQQIISLINLRGYFADGYAKHRNSPASISSNSAAATVLATLSISLSSLIAALAGSFSKSTFLEKIVYGDQSSTTILIKYVALLSCFLIAFSCFVQSSRYFIHSNFLLTTPNTSVPLKYVQQDVLKGGNFWSAGIRALYFAIILLLWLFGPIPLFSGSVIMVMLLNFLDSNSCPMHDYRSINQNRWQRVGAELTSITQRTGHMELHSGDQQ